MINSKLGRSGWAVLAIVFLYIAHAISSAIPAREGIEIEYANTERITRSFAIQNNHDTMTLSVPKRTLTSNLALLHSQVVAAIQPPGSAAIALEAFYRTIHFGAIHIWPNIPPQPYFLFRYGAFELSMSSAGGPIPWEWLAEFAHQLQGITVLGFTNTYIMVFSNPDQTHAISVSFAINMAARALEEAVSMIPIAKPARSASGSNR